MTHSYLDELDQAALKREISNAGKQLELRWLSGGVVELGAKVGVPTPHLTLFSFWHRETS